MFMGIFCFFLRHYLSEEFNAISRNWKYFHIHINTKITYIFERGPRRQIARAFLFNGTETEIDRRRMSVCVCVCVWKYVYIFIYQKKRNSPDFMYTIVCCLFFLFLSSTLWYRWLLVYFTFTMAQTKHIFFHDTRLSDWIGHMGIANCFDWIFHDIYDMRAHRLLLLFYLQWFGRWFCIPTRKHCLVKRKVYITSFIPYLNFLKFLGIRNLFMWCLF